MSKEVIIDGVDVSRCTKYAHKENICLQNYLFCTSFHDCDYKKLKKCEQKLEKIKEICQTYDQNGVYYNLTEDILKVIEGAEDE